MNTKTALALAAGLSLGRTTAPAPDVTWQDVVLERAVEGCLPTVSVDSVGKPEQLDQLTAALELKAKGIGGMYPDARNIETRVLALPPDGTIAKK